MNCGIKGHLNEVSLKSGPQEWVPDLSGEVMRAEGSGLGSTFHKQHPRQSDHCSLHLQTRRCFNNSSDNKRSVLHPFLPQITLISVFMYLVCYKNASNNESFDHNI